MSIPTPSPPLLIPGELALSECEKAETLADSLETQFQPVNDPSVLAAIEVFNQPNRAYSFAPASKLQLTNPKEVPAAIRGLKVGKTPGRGYSQYSHWASSTKCRFPSSHVI